MCVSNHHCWPTLSWQYVMHNIRIIRTEWSASPVYNDDDWHACIDAYCCLYYRSSVRLSRCTSVVYANSCLRSID